MLSRAARRPHASPLGLCCGCHGDSRCHHLLCAQTSLQSAGPSLRLILTPVWAVTHRHTGCSPGHREDDPELLGICGPETKVLKTSQEKGFVILSWASWELWESLHFDFQPDSPKAQESKAVSQAVR